MASSASQPPEFESSVRLKNGKFAPVPWESWLRMFISFICGAMTVAYFAASKSRDIEGLLTWKGEMSLWRERVEKEGTSWARWNTEQQAKNDETQQAKIAVLQQHEEMQAVMRQKLERLEDDVKELKNSAKK